jgi:hypothetical protein
MWSVRIDALNGKLLEKNDLVISCQFDRDIPYAHEEAGSESWFTSFDNSISKFIHHLLIRLFEAVNIIPFNSEVRTY